jgi:hypothetical protein
LNECTWLKEDPNWITFWLLVTYSLGPEYEIKRTTCTGGTLVSIDKRVGNSAEDSVNRNVKVFEPHRGMRDLVNV